VQQARDVRHSEEEASQLIDTVEKISARQMESLFGAQKDPVRKE
jgi:hypothetical protein